MRIVLDANVYASSLMSKQGSPALVLKYILENSANILILSQSIIEEIKRILFYPKVRTRINLTDNELLLWLESIELIANIIVPKFTYPNLVIADPADDQYLIAAIESNADYIISGDKHLLDLREYHSISILTPVNFLKIIN